MANSTSFVPEVRVEGNTSQSEELVVNGEFDSDTNWTKGTGWSIVGGVATCDGSVVSGYSTLSQELTNINVGSKYEVSFDVTVTLGYIAPLLGATSIGGTPLTGSHTFIVIPSDTTGLYFRGSQDFVGSVDNISVKEVLPLVTTAPIYKGDYVVADREELVTDVTALVATSDQYSTVVTDGTEVTITVGDNYRYQGAEVDAGLTIGLNYIVTFDLLTECLGKIWVGNGSSVANASNTTSTVGSKVVHFTATSSFLKISDTDNTQETTIHLDNISVKQVDEVYRAAEDTADMYDISINVGDIVDLYTGDIVFVNTDAFNNANLGEFYKRVGATALGVTFSVAALFNDTAKYTYLGTASNMSLQNPYFEVRDNNGISNQILALHKQDATTKEYLGIHKEIAMVDFEAGKYRQGMLDNGFSEVEYGLYSKGDSTFTFIGIWQTLNKGIYEPTLNFTGTATARMQDFSYRTAGWSSSSILGGSISSVAECFTKVIGSSSNGGQGNYGTSAYDSVPYIGASRPQDGTVVGGKAYPKFYDIVYKDQFIYAPEYANNPSIQERSRQEIDLLSADEGTSSLVSIESLKTLDSTLTLQDRNRPVADFSVNVVGNFYNLEDGVYLFGDGGQTYDNNETYDTLISTNTGVYIKVVAVLYAGGTTYIYIDKPYLFADSATYFTSLNTYSIMRMININHLSQGSHLITDRVGDPANYEKVALDRLAESKPLIGQNALLIGQDGEDYTAHAAPYRMKASTKNISGIPQYIYSNNGGISFGNYIMPEFDSINNNFNYAPGELTEQVALLGYEANNNPAIKQDPLPMLTVDSKAMFTNSHSLYKGASVGNMNGKIQVGNGDRGYESKLLENTEFCTNMYTNDINSTSVYFGTDYPDARIGVPTSITDRGEEGNVYVYVGTGRAGTLNPYTYTNFSNGAYWELVGNYIVTPEHSTTTLDNSVSPANKYFTGYAYDDNGIEYKTYNVEEIEYDTTWGDNGEFNNLTNSTNVDLNGNTMNTGFFAVPTGFKKGDK